MVENNIQYALPEGDPGSESAASAVLRVCVSVVAGLVVGVLAGYFFAWRYLPLVTWDTAAIIFLVWIWAVLSGRDAQQTASLAVREDPGRAGADVLLVLASVVSLAAVAVLLVQSKDASKVAEITQVALGIFSVIISWAIIHTIFALRYAREFYKNKGGIDFNDHKAPCYSDFAYLAFTIGMTFQVSDTTFTSSKFRKIALRHALLAYLFGTVIVAVTINLIAGLRN